jgi:hypothetical protein
MAAHEQLQGDEVKGEAIDDGGGAHREETNGGSNSHQTEQKPDGLAFR